MRDNNAKKRQIGDKFTLKIVLKQPKISGGKELVQEDRQYLQRKSTSLIYLKIQTKYLDKANRVWTLREYPNFTKMFGNL